MRRILIVEDGPDVRRSLQDFFELNDFEVVTAANGLDAIEILRQDPELDIVLLDVRVPGMDGFSVLHELRRTGIQTPVVMLTAVADEQSILKGFDLGAVGYVTKPFNPDVLLARVEAVLRRARPELSGQVPPAEI